MPRRRRAPLRKFVWARSVGVLSDATPAADLLGQFQQEYGAQLLGATVVRTRGFIVPTPSPGSGDNVFGVIGMIVEGDDDLAQTQGVLPQDRPHDDWMVWHPYWMFEGTGAAALANAANSFWTVDFKSARKIEELGQGLHLWKGDYTGSAVHGVRFDLSVGLKLP